MEYHILNAAMGAGVGVAFGIVGYIKNRNESAKKSAFDWKKMAPTVIITAMAGAIVGSQGMPLTETSIASGVASLGSLGITEFVKSIFSAIKG